MFGIAADERAALQFEDLASALDAGLPLAAIGANPAHGERALHELLRHRGVALSPSEDAVLLAAQRAGRAPAALRLRADLRRQRSIFSAELWRGVRYPLLVAGMVVVAGFATAPVVGHFGIPLTMLAVFGLGLGLGLLARRGLQHGSEAWQRLPVVGPLARDLGELPYLEILQGLYAAGVPLLQAHPAAVAAVPVAAVRRRLQIADRILQSGQPLREALAAALAGHPETRSLLATGELSGNLEPALQRAWQRRREVAGRSAAILAKALGAACFAVAATATAATVVSFYGRVFALAGG